MTNLRLCCGFSFIVFVHSCPIKPIIDAILVQMLRPHRHLIFRPSPKPGIISPVTVRSAGHYVLEHWHERRKPQAFTQVIWVEKGTVRYRKRGADFQADENEAFFLGTGEPHHLDVTPPGARYWWITYDSMLVDQWLNRISGDSSAMRPGHCPTALFQEIESLVGLPRPEAEKNCAALGLELLIRFAGPAEFDVPAKGAPLARKLQKEIETSFRDPDFGIERAAERLNCHRSTLYRAYREHFGLTPSRYLQRLRLQAGLDLLRAGRFNIDEAARESGFRDGNYFARTVREATGESPRAFRQMATGQRNDR